MVGHTTSCDHLSLPGVASSARILGCARNCFCLESEESFNTSTNIHPVCAHLLYHIAINVGGMKL